MVVIGIAKCVLDTVNYKDDPSRLPGHSIYVRAVKKSAVLSL